MLCFRKILVAINLWIRRRGKCQVFPSKIFRLKVPEKVVRKPVGCH